MLKQKKIKLNTNIVICTILFMIISCITIYSAMTYLPNYLGNLSLKQLLWYIIGFLIVLIISKISNTTLYKYAWYIYITNIILLFLLLIIGEPINGSKCWFIIPSIGSFQPSEFMKIGIILTASIISSNWVNNLSKKITWKQEIKLLLKIGIIFLIPSVLTFLEPDTGAVFIYLIICLSIIIATPIRKRWYIIGIFIILIGLTSFFGLYFIKQDTFINIFGTSLFYRIDRLLDWKNGTGMQLENSLVAIGSSGLFGHGYNKTPIYFPESGTDFIFAVFASNFGLIGCIFFIGLLVFFNYSIIQIGYNSKKLVNKFTISGILGMLIYQEFQNIGMTLGILPITGITLPFISYGGSSLLSYMIIIGIIINIDKANKKTMN